MQKNYYMIRIRDKRFDIIEPKSVVAVGWSNYNFAETERETLIEQINNDYAPQSRTNNLNKIKRFLDIKKGDYIIIPHYSDGIFDGIGLAVSDGEYIYDEDCKTFDLANQLKVRFLRDKDGSISCVDKTQLSEPLLHCLKLPYSTILDLDDFGDEIEEIVTNTVFSPTM